jgi:hypothetical protein
VQKCKLEYDISVILYQEEEFKNRKIIVVERVIESNCRSREMHSGMLKK